MKYCLIFIIRIYQLFFSFLFKGKCLFKESCSNKVLRECENDGFKSAIIVLKKRYNNCQPGYQVFFNKTWGEVNLISKEGILYRQNEISDQIVNEINPIAQKYQEIKTLN